MFILAPSGQSYKINNYPERGRRDQDEDLWNNDDDLLQPQFNQRKTSWNKTRQIGSIKPQQHQLRYKSNDPGFKLGKVKRTRQRDFPNSLVKDSPSKPHPLKFRKSVRAIKIFIKFVRFEFFKNLFVCQSNYNRFVISLNALQYRPRADILKSSAREILFLPAKA